MSGMIDRFAALAAQGRDDDVLLSATWFEGMGQRLFGPEAIVGALRRHPMAMSDSVKTVACADALAMIDGEQALFADLIGGRAHRLWRVGTEVEPGLPITSVAFDPDLGQIADRVWFTASDHPNLASDAAARLLAHLDEHAQQAEDGQTRRCRIAVRRAFATDDAIAALLTLYRWPASGARVPTPANAVLVLSGDRVRLASDSHDPARLAAAWRPRI